VRQESLPAGDAASTKARPFYGWWIVFSGFLANFAYAEQFNSTYGVFVQPIGAEMGWGRTPLAGVQALSRVPEAVVAVVLGPAVDRYGARWIMGFGGLVMAGSFFALALIDELWQLFLIKGIVMAVGAMCLGGFIGVTVSNWFVVRRGWAMGFISMGSSLATATMPVLSAIMIQHWGWRQAWVAMGALGLVLTVPAVVFVRRRPEDVGMHPDGFPPPQPSPAPPFPPRHPIRETAHRRREALLAADVRWTRGQVLRTPVLWIVVFAWGVAGFAITGTNLHLVPFMQDLGYSLPIAAGAVSVRAAAMLVGNPVWGLLAERIPVTVAASVQFLCQASAMLLFLVSPTPLGILGALLLYGIGGAGGQVVQETIWADYFGRLSLGLVRSLVYPFQTIFAAIGPVAMGLVYDAAGGYEVAWGMLFCGFLAAGTLILFARPPSRASSSELRVSGLDSKP
jgi:MFS family permease